MAEATRLVCDDAYEEMGSAYQCVQVAALDAASADFYWESALDFTLTVRDKKDGPLYSNLFAVL